MHGMQYCSSKLLKWKQQEIVKRNLQDEETVHKFTTQKQFCVEPYLEWKYTVVSRCYFISHAIKMFRSLVSATVVMYSRKHVQDNTNQIHLSVENNREGEREKDVVRVCARVCVCAWQRGRETDRETERAGGERAQLISHQTIARNSSTLWRKISHSSDNDYA